MIRFSDLKNKLLLEMASDEKDIQILEGKLVDFIICSENINKKDFQQLVANILLLCRSHEEFKLNAIRSALATALFMIHSPGSAVCMLDEIESFVKKLN